MRQSWRRALKASAVAVVMMVGLSVAVPSAVYGQEQVDKVLIRIYEQDANAKTTSFNLATNEIHIEPQTGYVEITRADTKLESKQVDYAQKDQRAVLYREVTAQQPDLDLAADKLTVTFDDDIYVAEGNVHLIQWNIDEASQRLDQKLSLDADTVTMDNKAEVVHAVGNVYVEESDRRIWAETMDYNQGDDMMVFTGSVRVETADGNKITGNQVVVDLATDEATVFGPVEAEFILESGSEDEGEE